MKIEDEIKQAHFDAPTHKAGMNLIFTANWLLNEITVALKPIDLSLQQLNVLRILKGQPKHTANVNIIRERLVDRMPNVSRLLNKLAEKQLVTKVRNPADQRVVYIKLTGKGEQAAEKGREIFKNFQYSIDNEQAEQLNEILEQLRK